MVVLLCLELRTEKNVRRVSADINSRKEFGYGYVNRCKRRHVLVDFSVGGCLVYHRWCEQTDSWVYSQPISVVYNGCRVSAFGSSDGNKVRYICW